jgi:hypothetical protein
MKSPTKLTKPQLMLLSAASRRHDRRVIMPERLRGGAAGKLLAALTAKGLIEPMTKAGKRSRAPGADIAGATDYRISAAGLARIGCDEDGPIPSSVIPPERGTGSYARRAGDNATMAIEHADKNGSGVDHGNQRRSPSNESTAPASTAGDIIGAADNSRRPPRAGSKLGQLVALLSSEAGATIDDLIRATGWLPHTARAALTELRHRGYDVRLERGGAKRTSVYRIAAAGSIAS